MHVVIPKRNLPLGHEPIMILWVGVVEDPVPPPNLKLDVSNLDILRYQERLAESDSLALKS